MQHGGKLSQGYDATRKKTTDLGIAPAMEARPELWADIDAQLYKIINETWQFYVDDTESAEILGSKFVDTCYLVQRYKKGEGYFQPHADASSINTSKRVAACLLYLNNVSRGGETNFPRLGFKIPARAGQIAWFPATYTHVHEGTMPISNDKYIITTFIEYGDE